MTTTSYLDLIWCDHHLQRQILMIFLFFGSSIAHQEPELQRFEDQLIFAGISAAGAPFGFRPHRRKLPLAPDCPLGVSKDE